MNFLPYPIIINLITEWPALAFINRYTYGIYKKYVKNKKYVTVEYYLNPCNKTLMEMCKEGKYIEIFNVRLDWNYGFYGACQGGYLNLVNKMIEKGADNWDEGLDFACLSGNLDIVNLMIEKGADDWNYGFSGACKGGNLNIVNLMIEKGAYDWNYGLSRACRGGNLDIVNLMIEKGADNWNWGLGNACMRDHLNIVNLMIEMGATTCVNCNNSKHNF